MENFSLFKIEKVGETELDTAIKSDSSNGLVKTRLPYTKIRKQFTITPSSIQTKEELDELLTLYSVCRTISPFTWTHPFELDSYNNPKQYIVRFDNNLKWERDSNMHGYYSVESFTLTEV